MAKYHFEIVDGFTLEDPIGQECSSKAQAKTVAKKIAEQIATDLDEACDGDERKVVVLDDHGAEIFKTKIPRAT